MESFNQTCAWPANPKAKIDKHSTILLKKSDKKTAATTPTTRTITPTTVIVATKHLYNMKSCLVLRLA
jgi:hypothetical protein